MPTFGERIKHAWNAFTSRDPTIPSTSFGMSYSVRPDRFRFTRGTERTIINSIYNRISIDVSSINIVHARLDENGRFVEKIRSGLNECLTVEANVDQSSRAFIQDIAMSLMDEGVIAVVPVDTTINPVQSASYEINSMRVGKIVQWYPRMVKVRAYDDITGKYDELTMPKSSVAIIENPFFSVMNEPNSTLKRLIKKLNLLDAIDAQSGAGKLDMIIQLPYVIKTEQRKKEAEKRSKDIEMQLEASKYGIAYIDGTEKITQLNRSVDNQILNHVEYLTNLLYSQLGISEEVFKGTADEKTMLNYYNRVIEPILSAIASEMNRKFLTKTARTQGQSIYFYRDPFKLVPVNEIAEIADKMTRNEILTSNEIRAAIGFKPSEDPKADELQNSNMYYDYPYEDDGRSTGGIIQNE